MRSFKMLFEDERPELIYAVVPKGSGRAIATIIADSPKDAERKFEQFKRNYDKRQELELRPR